MHGRVLLLFTSLLALIFTNSGAEHFAEDSYDRSCSPCGVQYKVTSRSERVENIARKCGYDEKTLRKYNDNLHHLLAEGSVISIPCPLGLKAKYSQIPGADYANGLVPFFSSHRLKEKITVTDTSIDAVNSTLKLYISGNVDPGFIGCGICGQTYNPSNGDTIQSVAKYCNISEDSLKNENLTDDNITSFQAINISCKGTDDINNCSKCGSWHRVQGGETLFGLAGQCNISFMGLGQANPGIDWNNIYPGQHINIPCANPNLSVPLDRCGPCGIEYIAKEEVGIQAISINCSVNITDLAALNPSVQGSNYRVPLGGRLRLPCGQSTCGPCGSLFTTFDSESIMAVASMCHVGTIALQLENKGMDLTVIPNNTILKMPCTNNQQTGSPCSKCSPNITLDYDSDVHGISLMCNVTADVILYANNIRYESEVIPQGETVYVPCASVPAQVQRTCSICGASIKLKAFVKIEVLAVLCNTTESAIIDVNPKKIVLDRPGVGDTIMLPCNINSNRGCGPCGISYVIIGESESLQSVAVKCATMAQEIQSANPEMDFTQSLAVDTVLDIPCFSSDLASRSDACARGSKFQHKGPANLLLRILLSQSWMAFVFSLFVLVL